MFNQLPRFPQNQEVKTIVQAAAGLSSDQSVLLGEFLQGKCRPPDWSPDYWEYLQSGEAGFVELANLLDLRMAFGKPFLVAIRRTEEELLEGLSACLRCHDRYRQKAVRVTAMAQICKTICKCGQEMFGLWRGLKDSRTRLLRCPSCKKDRQIVLVPIIQPEPSFFQRHRDKIGVA